MKKILSVIFILCFVLVASLYAEDGSGRYDYYSAIRELVLKTKDSFNFAKGYVDRMSGDYVYIRFSEPSGVRIGTIATIYRPGSTYTDPESKRTYPGIDVPVAVVRIESLDKGYAIGRVIKLKEKVNKGYVVKPPLEVCVSIDDPEVKEVNVDKSKLIETVKLAFTEETMFSVDKSGCLVDLNIKPKVVAGIGGEVFVSLLLSSSNFTIANPVSKVPSIMVATESNVEEGGAFLSRVFAKDYKFVVSMDVNGDGKDEIILAGDSFVDVFHINESGDLIPLISYDLGKRSKMLNKAIYFDQAKIDGKTYIFWTFVVNEVISGVYKAFPETYVLTISGKRIDLVTELKYPVRVVKMPDRDIVIGWNINEYGEFEGNPFLLSYRSGKFLKDDRSNIDLIEKVRALGSLYGWYYGLLDDSGKRFFAVIRGGSLEFYDDKGNFVASLNDPIGPYTALCYYATPRFYTPPAKKDFEPLEVAKRFNVERRIEAYKLPDGLYLFTVAHDDPTLAKFGVTVSSDYYGINGRVVGISRTKDRKIVAFYVAIETPKYSNAYALDFSIGELNGKEPYLLALSYLKNTKKTRLDVYKLGRKS